MYGAPNFRGDVTLVRLIPRLPGFMARRTFATSIRHR